MAQRSLGSVTISFGMVSIPVKLYVATEEKSIAFNLLHAGCGSRLQQQYSCIKEGVTVARDDMVKGYEFSKDQYVQFTKDELKALAEEATKTLEITEFVPSGSIDPIYYDKAYFVAPDKGGAKAYALLAEIMRSTGKTAVGRYAAKGKQHIIQLRPVDGGIVMQQLLYGPEVRSIKDCDIEPAKVNEAELALADQLVKAVSSEKFDPTKYEDQVAKRIQDAVALKIEGKQISSVVPATASTGKVVDLMEALQASLLQTAVTAMPPVAAKAKEEKVAKSGKKSKKHA